MWLLALLLLLPATPSLRAMSKAARADVEPLEPRCFGYARHTFACLGHDRIYNTEHVGAPDQATNLRVDAIGPTTNERWTIAAIGGRPTTSRKAVERSLAKLGMRPLQVTPIRLANNAWTQVGAHPWKLRVDAHEGDASFENLGELTIRCGARDVIVDLRGADLELGETAVAYVAPDDSGLVVPALNGDPGIYSARWAGPGRRP